MSSFDFHDGRSRILPHDYGIAVNHSTIPWHVLSEKDVCLKVGSSWAGLSLKEVEARQKIHEPNALPIKRPPSVLTIFFR
jgi:hypothetical protein